MRDDFMVVFGTRRWVTATRWDEEQRDESHEGYGRPLADGGLGLTMTRRGGGSREHGHGRVHVDEGLCVTLCGQWRNMGELRAALGLDAGCPPARVLAAGYRREGLSFLARLRGTASGFVWDRATGQFHAFRDKLGLRPLLYRRHGRHAGGSARDAGDWGVVLGSDADALRARHGTNNRVNRRRLVAFLSNSVDAGCDDFFEDQYRVRPGEVVTWDTEGREQRRYYWQPDTSTLAPDDALAARIVDVLESFDHGDGDGAARPRVVALSGGLDSSTLAALETIRGGYGPARRLPAVSMYAPELPRADETPVIRQIARGLPVEVHLFAIDDRWPLRSVDFYGRALGAGPQSHPEEFWVDAYHRWIVERFGPVDLLCGHGADDVLWCAPAHFFRAIVEGRRLDELARAVARAGPIYVLRNLVDWGLERLGYVAPPVQAPPPLPPAADAAAAPGSNRSGRPRKNPWRNPLHWVRPVDGWSGVHGAYAPPRATWGQVRLERIRTWKWELVCRTLDREARRNAVNTVFPMLDDRLWDLCLRIAPEQLAEGGRQKAVLRKAMAGRLPHGVVHRPKHGGFDAVVEKALTRCEAPLVEALFRSSRLAQLEVIDPIRFNRIYRSYCQAAHTARNQPYLGSLAIWQTVAAEVWLGWLHQS